MAKPNSTTPHKDFILNGMLFVLQVDCQNESCLNDPRKENPPSEMNDIEVAQSNIPGSVIKGFTVIVTDVDSETGEILDWEKSEGTSLWLPVKN